jgi:hypothetical protein
MTNSTNIATNNTNSTIAGNNMKIETVNDSALASIIASNVFHKVHCTQTALVIACSLVDALDQPDYFLEMFIHTMETAQLRTVLDNKSTTQELDLDMEAIALVLVEMGFVTEEGEPGDSLIALKEMEKEAYAPTTGEIVRRNPTYKLEKGQASDLLVESITAQEKTMFTVDSYMLNIANKVQAITGGVDADDEAYVLAGCNNMDPKQAYHSEFMADRRGRTYQAACHGPIAAASDRSRALMDLVGVPTSYDVPTVMSVIKAEMEDMTKCIKTQVIELNMIGEEQFIINHTPKGTDCKKPWSFVKAVRIVRELKAGNRPYIGMAVGLDAKCSGPQLAALMVGDADLAAACGMTLVQVEDAYERCVQMLAKFGFHGFTRNGVKKAFMGVFYGQGYAAFTDVKGMMEEEDMKEVVAILAPQGIISDDVAKKFHKAITQSFGKKLVALRERFKEFNGKVQGRIGHTMPDGFKIQMNYKVKWNILNEAMEFGVEAPDAHIVTGDMTRKFIKVQLNTLEVHTGDFVRNGFVNMVQGTDALIARLIITQLDRLGAQHILGIHDCFRVNVTEMHLLKQAIINAYMILFGTKVNCKSADLPMGQDILGMYFEGASKQLVEGEKVVPMPQFLPFGPKPRKMAKIGDNKIEDVIQALGTSYYFAK